LKIVLDTNVLVSGFFYHGVPNTVFKRWLNGDFQVCVSAVILEEYDRAMKEMALKFQGVETDEVLGMIRSQVIVVQETAFGEHVCTDPDDDKFLACAIEAQALLIVTGDKALLKTDGYKGVHVMKPAPFLALLDEK
jgi:putative PIN family toxin of toxin-antitoxin system